ncbi:hypothetical protein ACIBQ1_23765 [Nonomuraea sp. NPDC050153]|uniref:hypothetical protein n=1 Tax=Nonomuraea sp. NPDC050153 TaxID=3364359 RepID=UPI00378C3A50
MPPALLRSQSEALDPLEADEKGATVSVDASSAEIARRPRYPARIGGVVEAFRRQA